MKPPEALQLTVASLELSGSHSIEHANLSAQHAIMRSTVVLTNLIRYLAGARGGGKRQGQDRHSMSAVVMSV